MFPAYVSNRTPFHWPMNGWWLWKSDTRRLVRNVAFMLFIKVDGNAISVCVVTLCRCKDDDTGNLLYQMHKQSFTHDNSCDLFAIYQAVIVEEMKFHAYPYTFHTLDQVRSTFPDLYSDGVYAWNSQEMKRSCARKAPLRQPFPAKCRNRTIKEIL